MRLIEVSHVIEAGMQTYPGLPVPVEDVVMDYADSRRHYEGDTEFFIASLHLCGNTGTYVDSPRHRYRDGADLASLPLERLAHVPVVRVDAPGPVIDATALRGVEVAGRAVLFHTGWSRHWRTPQYFDTGNPHLTAGACRALVDGGAALAGIDSVNIDSLRDRRRPAHTILLGAGIPVCEHMTNLDAVRGGFLHAVPIAWRGGATFPVRAYVVEV